MKKIILVFLIQTVWLLTSAQVYTVESVPNTKLQTNSYVSNPDGLINQSTITQLDQMLAALEQQTTAQVAVVMLHSIGDQTDFDFAQALFEKWGIGGANKDNGLLILFIEDQRTVRLHTGFGLEGILSDAICKQIQIQKMVPQFKEGNVDAGMIAGVEEVVRILTDPAYADEINEATKPTEVSLSDFAWLLGIGWVIIGMIVFLAKRKSGFSDSANFKVDGPHSKMSTGQWFLLWMMIPIGLLIVLPLADSTLAFAGGLYGFFGLTAFAKYVRMNSSADSFIKKGEYQSVYNFYNENKGVLGLAFLFPIPFAFLRKHFTNKMNLIRTRPRVCKKCGGESIKFSETQEDEHLSKEAQFEENIKSVDYDVWKCNSCHEILYEAYISEKTNYTECPSCKTHANYVTNSSIKKAATTSVAGIMLYQYLCKFCKHKSKVESVIPKIVVSSSSSSSDSGSSSSSDSGGSYGGGDSGGGGSSSSW